MPSDRFSLAVRVSCQKNMISLGCSLLQFLDDITLAANRDVLDGKIILDISGEEKKKLTVADLLQKFEVAGENALSDRMVLGAK